MAGYPVRYECRGFFHFSYLTLLPFLGNNNKRVLLSVVCANRDFVMHLEQPRLRPFLSAAVDHTATEYVVVWDRLGLSAGGHRFTRQEFTWLQRFTGQRTLNELLEEIQSGAGGPDVNRSYLEALVLRLEQALLLDSPNFRQLADGPVRPPRCIGCYAGEPHTLRKQLRELFTGPRGPGLPQESKPSGTLRAALIPHIDYPRGGSTYAWGFKEVVEQTDASLFVILGTSHYSHHRFTLTRKHFQTPLGVAETDQDYIDRLVQHYGPGLFDDEWLAHFPEHSIELEVVFLQYLYEHKRPIRIVPLVVGSFHDCVQTRQAPGRAADIGRMVRALQQVEKETQEPICYIISGDLAHIGPKFGDYWPAQDPWLSQSRDQDQAILRQTESASPHGLFEVIARESDGRRICGLPPTYTTLAAVQPSQGKVLRYDQYVHPQGNESVSFASVAFYK